MPFLIGALVIFVLVIAPLYERYKLHRANARFQRSIWTYDEARRRRILAGEDPRSIPTVEEYLHSIGRGAHVKNIERTPRPDPVVPHPAPTARSISGLPLSVPPIARTPPAGLPIAEEAPVARNAPSEPSPLPQVPEPPSDLPSIAERPIGGPVPVTAPQAYKPPPPEKVLEGEVVLPRARSSLVRLEAVTPAEPSLKYRITYMTEWGEVTERRIRVKRVYSEHGEVYIEAHCYLRRAQRTFRADRISEMTDLDYDLPILDPVGHFADFIDPEEIVTPEHELVMGKARPGLYALVWVGRAGGDLEADTLSVLVDFVSRRARMGRGATSFNAALAERWIADQRPTFEIAAGSLANMRRGGPEWQMTYEAGKSVVACDEPEKRHKRLVRLFRP